MISGHTIRHHLYADDSQLYVSFASGDSAVLLNGLQSCLASVQSWMLPKQLKLNPDKTEFLPIGNEWQQIKYLFMFPIEILGVKPNPTNLLRILEYFFTKFSPSAHLYQQSAADAFTTSRICGVFAISLIWIVQNYLQLLLWPAVLIIAIPFCVVLRRLLTSSNFNVFRIDWSTLWQITSIYSQCHTASFLLLVTTKI